MSRNPSPFVIAAFALTAIACTDSPNPLEPAGSASQDRSVVAQDRLAALFASVSPAVMALPGTVFADHDEPADKLVFGVENANAGYGVQKSLAARGVSTADYEIRVTEPIQNMATLRDRFRPTQGGIQIHWSNYACTLGFNVDHAGGRSFITNSHCTDRQGGTEGTTYAQPLRSVDPTVIATEADDPTYFTGGDCSVGKKCRYSDASRALYSSDVTSSRGVIAKTAGVNNGSLTVDGSFTVTGQNNGTSFSGTVHKVGRTTGWTFGTVSNTCTRVNVLGSNIQLICQTLVENGSATIVGSGDSGSPVFVSAGGDNVTLVGILWGGSSSGDRFVFSPLKNIQDELGALVATADGSGGGGAGGGGDEPAPCIPKGPHGKNCK